MHVVLRWLVNAVALLAAAFVVNALMLMLTGRLARAFHLGFRVDGFDSALLGALVIAVVIFILGRAFSREL